MEDMTRELILSLIDAGRLTPPVTLDGETLAGTAKPNYQESYVNDQGAWVNHPGMRELRQFIRDKHGSAWADRVPLNVAGYVNGPLYEGVELSPWARVALAVNFQRAYFIGTPLIEAVEVIKDKSAPRGFRIGAPTGALFIRDPKWTIKDAVRHLATMIDNARDRGSSPVDFSPAKPK